MESLVALLVVTVVIYALAAGRLNRLSIGPGLFFVLVGIAVALAPIGTLPSIDHEVELGLVEITLALVLFGDASTIDLAGLRSEANLVGRLLSGGLLLTIALGTLLAAILFPELPFGVLLLLGAALAPTDAALGQPVVSNPVVPVRIRRLLNAESGLNDGIATPFVVLAIAIIGSEGISHADWVTTAIREGAVGVAVGIVGGAAGGLALVAADRRQWTSRDSRQLAVLGLAVACYLGSVAAGGNGFIAAFVGGLAFGSASRHAEEGATRFTEEAGSLLSIATWIVAGTAFVRLISAESDLRPVVYAMLSLTVVRMLPVALVLARTGLRRETILFVGWFGPRGLASIVFGLLGLEAMEASLLPFDLVGATIAWTIFLSVVLHGLSAGRLAEWYGRRIAELPGPLPENDERPEPATRTRLSGTPQAGPSAGPRSG